MRLDGGDIFIIVLLTLVLIFVFYGSIVAIYDNAVGVISNIHDIDNVITISSSSGSFSNNGTDNYTRRYNYFINITKTSGGLPYLKNDVYDTLGVVVYPASWDRYGWEVGFEALDLASSKANDSEKSSNAIKSQTLIVNGTYIGQEWGGDGITIGSWPHRLINGVNWKDNATDMNSQMTQNTINATRSIMPFPLNESELTNNLIGGSDTKDQVSTELWNKQKIGEKIAGWDWIYSNWPWENKPDSAAVSIWQCGIPYGSTLEFDVIDNTYSSLFDESNAVVHVKITVPPDPSLMNKSELKTYNITAWVINDTFVSTSNGNKVNITYVPSAPNIVGYSTNNISVELS